MTNIDIKIDWIGGFCPVQSEGRINGKEYYFRSRGSSWRLEVGEWVYSEEYGEGIFDAGYISEGEAEELIRKAATIFVHESQNN